jgi:hypothetical protein
MITFTWDTFIMVLVIVIVSFIIGMNIVSVIDNKLGTVEVNVPKPNLIVNIKKNTGDIETFVENPGCKMIPRKNKVENFGQCSIKPQPTPKLKHKLVLKKLDTFEDDLNSDKVENFTKENDDVPDDENNIENMEDIGAPEAEHINEKEGNKMDSIKIKNKTDRSIKKLENPDEEDIVDYGNYICYRKPVIPIGKKIKKVEKIETMEQNDNNNNCVDRIMEKKRTGDKLYKPYNTCGQISDDPADFYKRFKPYVSHMTDPFMDSYNVGEYVDKSGIYSLGNINLEREKGTPKPYGSR